MNDTDNIYLRKRVKELEEELATLHNTFYYNDQRHKKRIRWLENRVEAGDRHEAELMLKYQYKKEELKELLTEKK